MHINLKFSCNWMELQQWVQILYSRIMCHFCVCVQPLTKPLVSSVVFSCHGHNKKKGEKLQNYTYTRTKLNPSPFPSLTGPLQNDGECSFVGTVLEKQLVSAHHVVFLLTPTSQNRWLPSRTAQSLLPHFSCHSHLLIALQRCVAFSFWILKVLLDALRSSW